MASLGMLTGENFEAFRSLEFDLGSKGLILITGGNGEGKSTIFNAVAWCLFGTDLKGDSGDDVVNNVTNKDCWVNLNMDHPDGYVSVTRYRKHKKEHNNLHFDLFTFKGERHPLDGWNTDSTQAKIEAFLEMNMNMFVNSVIFAQGYSKFFASLGDTEQKALIEGFIHAEVYTKAYKLADLDRKRLEVDIQGKDRDKDLLEGKCESLKEEIESYNQGHKDFEANRQLKLEELRVKLKSVELERKQLAEKLAEITQSKEKAQSLLVPLEEIEVDKCATCGQDLPIKEAERIFDLREFICELESSTIPTLMFAIKINTRDQASLNKEIEASISTENNFAQLIKLAKTKEAHLKHELTNARADLDSLMLEQKDVELWKEAYSPRGIKAYLFDDILPDLNLNLNNYTQDLSDGQITATINPDKVLKSGEVRNKFSITINNITGGKSFKSSSAGEKRVINLGFLFAIQDMTRDRLSVPMSISVLDEVLDCLDKKHVNAVFEILEEQAKDRTIFVISHNPALKRLFDKAYVVKKSGGGSKVVEVDNYEEL